MLAEELAGQLSPLTDTLVRIAESLSPSGPRRQPRRELPEEALDVLASSLATLDAGPEEEAAPEARPCAVIGCKRPVRSLGYCAAHYQKRRLMVASGRLHHAWTEDAAPNSIPDVILGRKRRESAEAMETVAITPAPVRPSEGPRVWVRKKGVSPVVPTPSGDSQPVLQLAQASVIPTAQRSEREQVASIVEQWASEFRANKHRS
ncbi:cell wall protein [Myxococcus sp. SDU36]|uniref:cell wall protein n=1 Tax=Myxococcus sp. SDU36 TaxID=2831967 RepID=UPI002542B4A6|nr:cell wall protein [Myxococcus sp. SDU36]